MINKIVEWTHKYGDESYTNQGILYQFVQKRENIVVGIVLMNHGMFQDVPFEDLKVISE